MTTWALRTATAQKEMESFAADENKAGRFGKRPRINSYSFSAQVLLTVKNCRYLFSQRSRPMKGTRYFAPANEMPPQKGGYGTFEWFIVRNIFYLDKSNCEYLKAKSIARSFRYCFAKVCIRRQNAISCDFLGVTINLSSVTFVCNRSTETLLSLRRWLLIIVIIFIYIVIMIL